MVDEGQGIGRELSTVSTPPTVGTTVETSEDLTILDPRRAREEKQGGCGGGEGKPPEAAAVDPAWARALSSQASCQVGRCAYTDPAKAPNRYLGAIGCDGYHASRSTEGERVTVRWGLCPRHREWWRLERIRRSAARKGA
jgi:hypothetical protein